MSKHQRKPLAAKWVQDLCCLQVLGVAFPEQETLISGKFFFQPGGSIGLFSNTQMGGLIPYKGTRFSFASSPVINGFWYRNGIVEFSHFG